MPGAAPDPATARYAPAPARARDRPEEKVNIIRLALGVIFSPGHALENLLPLYVRDATGALKIFAFYAVCLAPPAVSTAVMAAVVGEEFGGLLGAAASVPAAIALQLLGSILVLVILSLEISLIVTLFGRGMGFFNDAAALTLRFALVQGVTQVVIYSLTTGLALLAMVVPGVADFSLHLGLATWAWSWYLSMLVIMVTYDYEFFEAVFVMIIAQAVAVFAAFWVAAKIIGALGVV